MHYSWQQASQFSHIGQGWVASGILQASKSCILWHMAHYIEQNYFDFESYYIQLCTAITVYFPHLLQNLPFLLNISRFTLIHIWITSPRSGKYIKIEITTFQYHNPEERDINMRIDLILFIQSWGMFSCNSSMFNREKLWKY